MTYDHIIAQGRTFVRAIKALVRRLLGLRGEEEEVVALEAELNKRVYRLFGLLDEEIASTEECLGQNAG